MQVFKPASPFRRDDRSAEESGQERDEGDANEGDTAAGHQLLHACDQAKRVVPGGEDFAPGLSLPVYAPLRSAQSRRPPDVVRPSSRLIAPQMPRPAPSAMTRVCSTPTALLKNAIVNSSLLDAGELSPGSGNGICLRIPGNKNALIPHVHLQEKGSKIARTLMSAWLCKRHI